MFDKTLFGLSSSTEKFRALPLGSSAALVVVKVVVSSFSALSVGFAVEVSVKFSVLDIPVDVSVK